MLCPQCNSENPQHAVRCSRCGYNLPPSEIKNPNSSQPAYTSNGQPQKSFVGKAFISLALYLLACWIFGLISNIIFLVDANKIKKSTGIAPKGHGCLISLIIAQIAIIPLVMIIGLLSAIAVPGFIKARDNARENACMNNMRVIAHAVQQYTIDNNLPSNTPVYLYNDYLMPANTGRNPECYVPNYLTCPESGATYGDFVNNSTLDVTCPVKTAGRSHGTFGDLD